MSLHLLPRDAASRLREYFAGVQYTLDHLKDTLGTVGIPSRRLRTLPPLLDQTREATALNTLVRWFFLATPVEWQTASKVIPDWVLGTLLECGLLTRQNGFVAPNAMITPFGEMLLVSDSLVDSDVEMRPDLVLWPNATTLLLSRFTIRIPSRLTLDFGTGCGQHALEAAAHSERVVATDLSPRAIEFAAFNARLNGVENIEFLVGDAFEPVRGMKFDLITANPPFFVTPSNRLMYCDNELDLDQFCRRLAREAPDYLNENGSFQMLCEWAQVEGESWQDRVSGWLRGTGCDAWAQKMTSASAFIYAQEHFKKSVPYSPERDPEAFADWMSYYRERKVEWVHAGMIAMRRRSGENWIRIDESPLPATQPFGDIVQQMFENHDYLRDDAPEEQMLDAQLKLSPDAQLEQQLRQGGKGWQRSGLTLRLTGSAPASLAVQPQVAEFAGSFDGKRTVRELADALAARVSADPNQVRAECLRVVRQLLERNFLQSA